MPVDLFKASLILLASFAAGAVNSISGGGSLITFPALIFIGLDPLIANTSNTIAVWPGSLAAAFGLRRELARHPRSAMILSVPSILGGVAGAVLLIHTPARIFAGAAPWLVLGATLLFALQAQITRKAHSERVAHPGVSPVGRALIAAVAVQFVIAIYGGYFGAGMGIIMLAVLEMSGLSDIHEALALRNFLGLSINGVAAIYFAWRGAYNGQAALIMVAGQVVGGYGGTVLARRLHRSIVRRVIVVIGFVMALTLLIHQ